MRITRRVEIDAGHRLQRHGGKCATLYGHRYAFEATVEGDPNEVGVVLDFATLKERVGRVAGEWDHAVVLEGSDPLAATLVAAGQRVVLLSRPPSAENFAREMLDRLRRDGVRCVRVRCYETPTCWADAEVEP